MTNIYLTIYWWLIYWWLKYICKYILFYINQIWDLSLYIHFLLLKNFMQAYNEFSPLPCSFCSLVSCSMHSASWRRILFHRLHYLFGPTPLNYTLKIPVQTVFFILNSSQLTFKNISLLHSAIEKCCQSKCWHTCHMCLCMFLRLESHMFIIILYMSCCL